jgi:acetyltransferase-like isoleucine patch superfamily enzyme
MSSNKRLDNPRKYSWLSIDAEAFVSEKIVTKKGSKSFIGWGSYVSDNVSIGEGVLIGPNVTIIGSSHPAPKGIAFKKYKTVYKPIIIEDDVWIGAGSIILGGNIIKTGAILAAGAVLLED